MKHFYPRIVLCVVSLLFYGLFAHAQTTPANGTTTFNTIGNGAYIQYAQTSNGSAGFTANNVQNSGWDISGHTSGPGNYVIAGENWGGGSDGGFVYLALNTGGSTITSMRFKANDGKLFDLNTIDLAYDVSGANTNFTIRGYRAGIALPGASFSVPSFASFTNGGDWRRGINIAANSNFKGIDEFRITPNTPNLLFALDVDNINATNFRAVSFTQIIPVDIPSSNAGAFTKSIAGHLFTFTPSANNWVAYNTDVGTEGFGGLYSYDYTTMDGTETTVSAPPGYTFDLSSFQYTSDRGAVSLSVTLTFADNSTDTKNYMLTGNSSVHTFTGFTTAANDVKSIRLVTDALLYYNNFELIDIKAMSTLPLQWLQFTATMQETAVVLDWRTAAEQHTKDFVVQHSIEGRGWQNIGTVMAAGVSNGEQVYSFQHNNPAKGPNAYRLLQRDVDGRGSYSRVVSVNIKTSDEGFSVYPNPAPGGVAQIKLKDPAVVSVYNSSGMLMLKKQLPAGVSILDLSSYAKGVYTLTVKDRSLALLVQ
jgi:hypothetical protein